MGGGGEETHLVVQLLLCVQCLQIEEVLLEQMDIRLQEGLAKSLQNRRASQDVVPGLAGHLTLTGQLRTQHQGSFPPAKPLKSDPI